MKIQQYQLHKHNNNSINSYLMDHGITVNTIMIVLTSLQTMDGKSLMASTSMMIGTKASSDGVGSGY